MFSSEIITLAQPGGLESGFFPIVQKLFNLAQ